MKLIIIIMCCIVQTFAGTIIPSHKIEPRSISPRIQGGVDAAEGQAPYQCSLQRKPSGHYCGCAIISSTREMNGSSNWIITAAHCLQGEKPQKIQVVFGTNQWKSGGSHYAADKFIIHEHYDNPPFAYDIGLIRLKRPIKFNERVQPIKYSKNRVGAGENLQVTGWGLLRKHGRLPDNLQVLNVTSISNEECEEKSDSVHASHLCTLSPRGKGACNGDSGGPLVKNDGNDGHELVGIANFAVPCARGSPDGYARISYLYDWIETNKNSP